jgi:hypothetical protein
MMSVTSIVLDPDKFYRENGWGLLQMGVVVILLIGGLQTVLAGGALYPTLNSQSSTVGIGWNLVVIGIGMVLFNVILWLGFSVAFYVLSMVVGGRHDFRTMAMYVSWGFAPQLLPNLYSARRLLVDISGGVATSANVAQFDPFAAMLGLACSLWSAYLWVFAVKHARDISYKQALAVVVPVGGLWMLPSLASLPVW